MDLHTLQNKMDESWSGISPLFDKSSDAERDLMKSIHEFAYRAGYNTGYAAGLTDDLIQRVAGGENDVLANN